MVDHAGEACVDVATAEIFRRDLFAGRRFDERRSPKKMVPWLRTMIDSSLIAGT